MDHKSFRQSINCAGVNVSSRKQRTYGRWLGVELLEQREMFDAAGFIHAVFAPDTTTEYVESVEQMQQAAAAEDGTSLAFAAFQFNDSNRWSSTTSSGTPVLQAPIHSPISCATSTVKPVTSLR